MLVSAAKKPNTQGEQVQSWPRPLSLQYTWLLSDTKRTDQNLGSQWNLTKQRLKTASGLGFGLGGLDLRLGLDKNQAKQNQIKRSNQSKKQWETKKSSVSYRPSSWQHLQIQSRTLGCAAVGNWNSSVSHWPPSWQHLQVQSRSLGCAAVGNWNSSVSHWPPSWQHLQIQSRSLGCAAVKD